MMSYFQRYLNQTSLRITLHIALLCLVSHPIKATTYPSRCHSKGALRTEKLTQEQETTVNNEIGCYMLLALLERALSKSAFDDMRQHLNVQKQSRQDLIATWWRMLGESDLLAPYYMIAHYPFLIHETDGSGNTILHYLARKIRLPFIKLIAERSTSGTFMHWLKEENDAHETPLTLAKEQSRSIHEFFVQKMREVSFWQRITNRWARWKQTIRQGIHRLWQWIMGKEEIFYTYGHENNLSLLNRYYQKQCKAALPKAEDDISEEESGRFFGYVRACSYLDVVHYLSAYGRHYMFLVEEETGNNVLHYAVMHPDREWLAYLMDTGGKNNPQVVKLIAQKNKHGESPLDIAKQESAAIAALLERAVKACDVV